MAVMKEEDLKTASTSTNVLHYFRSFNYLFTLSAVDRTAFSKAVTEQEVAALADQFVVARSAGKGPNGIDVNSIKPIKRDLTAEQLVQFDEEGVRLLPAIVDDYSGKQIVEKFNELSSGKYDFYFDNFEIETIMAFDKRTGFSKASKISFTIVEPYSLAGLIEAMQTAAVAAGHPTYKSCPFILKLEFKGYPDWNPVSTDRPMVVPNATRYFIILFSDMQIQADAEGTKYTCKAVPLNETAFGEPNKLKTNINIQGNTVGEILKYFEEQLNRSSKEINRVSTSEKIKGNMAQADEYEIRFPAVNPDTGELDFESTNKMFVGAEVANLSVDNVPWAFIDPVTHETTTAELQQKGIKKAVYTPKTVSSQFASNANIHDCISAIIRDSSYGTDIFEKIATRTDKNDLIDYFNIVTEAIPKEVWDSATNRPYYTYKFYVVPYKIHITRIPGYESGTIDETKTKRIVRRSYNYLYTGKNRDITSFNLTFNNLYFQNQPLREGNQALGGEDAGLTKKIPDIVTSSQTSDTQLAQGSGSSVNERRVDVRSTEVGYGGESTRPLQDDPYATMVKNLHQAIIDNVGMASLDIEILGDPLYLVQNGFGNLRVKINPDYPGMTVTGDLDFQSSDVYVEVIFRNPKDIKKDGYMEINESTSFSGLYRVNTVVSKFNGGMFTQRLSMIRMPAQPSDTNQKTPSRGITISFFEDSGY